MEGYTFARILLLFFRKSQGGQRAYPVALVFSLAFSEIILTPVWQHQRDSRWLLVSINPNLVLPSQQSLCKLLPTHSFSLSETACFQFIAFTGPGPFAWLHLKCSAVTVRSRTVAWSRKPFLLLWRLLSGSLVLCFWTLCWNINMKFLFKSPLPLPVCSLKSRHYSLFSSELEDSVQCLNACPADDDR